MATINLLNIGDEVALPGGGYPPVEAFEIPVLSGLKGAYFLNGGAKLARRNFAPGGRDAQIVGPVTEGTNYLVMPAGSYIDTGIPETAACSFMILCKKPTLGTKAGLIGTYNGGVSVGASLYCDAGVTNPQAAIEKVDGQDSTGTAGNLLNWGLIGVTVPATGAAKTYNFTAGNSTVSSNTAARAVTSTETVLIGGLPAAAFRDTLYVGFALIYEGQLSDAEVALLDDWGTALGERLELL